MTGIRYLVLECRIYKRRNLECCLIIDVGWWTTTGITKNDTGNGWNHGTHAEGAIENIWSFCEYFPAIDIATATSVLKDEHIEIIGMNNQSNSQR